VRLARIVTAAAIGLELISACARQTSPTPSTPSPAPVPSPQSCRTYATAWTATPTFGPAQSVTAAFDTTSHVYTESVAGTSLKLRQTTYQSVADFVDEPGVVGRVLFAQSATCPATAGCSGVLGEVETPVYDAARRRTGALHGVGGVTLFADTFTQWDRSGRPVSGSRTQPGVCDVPMTIAYDDTARTRMESALGSGSILCGVASTLSAVTYDADGNVLSESGSTGGTSTTVDHAISATARVCK
jgi:hypothetical protein